MKKVFLILATVLIMTTLVACGSNVDVNNNQTEEVTTASDILTGEIQNEESYIYQMTDQEIQAALADYHGEYRCEADANAVLIDDNGMFYNGEKLDIQSIGEGYVVINNSNLIIILGDGRVSADFTHADDNSYLDDYKWIGVASSDNLSTEKTNTANNNVPESNTQAADSSTPNASTQALSEEQLETYVGTYINTSTNNTCSFIGYDGNNGRVYKVEEIAVNNATRTSPDGICSPFSASEIEQNADGNFSIRRPTYLDFCTVTFLPDNQIVLKLEYDDGTYEETFSKQ